MKSKKLLVLIITVALMMVVVVVLSSVFAVRQVFPIYHNFEGGQVVTPDDAPTANDVLQLAKGKNIFFLSKEKVLNQLNSQFPQWHAIGVVKSFPNILEVHFVERVAVVQFNTNLGKVCLDSFGYVVDAPDEGSEPLDISSAFSGTGNEVSVMEKGKKFVFYYETSNKRLSCILESMMALWQCKCDIQNIPNILGKGTESPVFTFDGEVMIITTKVGAQIRVHSPESNLTERLIDAFSAYCDGTRDLQKLGVVITVSKDGNISTPNK